MLSNRLHEKVSGADDTKLNQRYLIATGIKRPVQGRFFHHKPVFPDEEIIRVLFPLCGFQYPNIRLDDT
ncbi:hypothetical protein [Gibbsiella quercinecans]|uniref:hypothetical protein n=1 Tax=Gibbsiella quercinecans TaxID=929813 RepID=UPI0011C3E0E0|nr:hypothetical protein [Gibbsiella quercinecans]